MADGSCVSLSTTRNVIKGLGFISSTPRYGQMVRDVNKDKRVKFCKELISSNTDLGNVIFSDESTVSSENFAPASYHIAGTANPIIPKAKHPAKVHVWGGISRRGATDILIFTGIMEKEFFTKNILCDTLLPFVNSTYPDGHVFQQDNDPKHRSKLAREFMDTNGINWMNNWPSGKQCLNIKLST